MGALALRTFLVLSMVVCLAGCRQTLRGFLTISEPLVIASASGPRQLSRGAYPVQVRVEGRHLVTLRIESLPGGAVTLPLVAPSEADAAGARRIAASANGQAFDVTYSVTSTKHEVPIITGTLPCGVETTVTRCRTVHNPATGEEREDCWSEPAVRRGSRTVGSVRATTTTQVTGQFLDAQSRRELATLSASVQRDRSYSSETPCG
jgi:hypothetical protein